MRLLAPAATLLAAIVLALAACSGGGTPPAPTATPEASPAAEAPSTPAPTAEATPVPSPAPTPEPPPEQACANGVAVEDPEARPGLVADCVALLASRDALRGETPLDWDADLAIGRWEGVAVGGEPPRVTGLDLRDRGLTGAIPRTLGEAERLSTLILADNALTGGIPRSIGRLPWLDEVRLAGNALTGCVPSAFGDARSDALYLGLPWCLRYDRLDATGEVGEAGEWAILGADGAVLATWEGLRSEAATLRVHQTDAGGTSWAAEFGAVSEGDLFEWRKASDCWVRYLVTGAPVRPSGGLGALGVPRRVAHLRRHRRGLHGRRRLGYRARRRRGRAHGHSRDRDRCAGAPRAVAADALGMGWRNRGTGCLHSQRGSGDGQARRIHGGHRRREGIPALARTGDASGVAVRLGGDWSARCACRRIHGDLHQRERLFRRYNIRRTLGSIAIPAKGFELRS